MSKPSTTASNTFKNNTANLGEAIYIENGNVDLSKNAMSEDETIATVDEFGVVTAHGVGETRISLLVNDIYESYTTIVVNEAPIDEVVAENENTTDSIEIVPATGDIAVIAIALIAAISVIGIVFVVIKNKRQK